MRIRSLSTVSCYRELRIYSINYEVLVKYESIINWPYVMYIYYRLICYSPITSDQFQIVYLLCIKFIFQYFKVCNSNSTVFILFNTNANSGMELNNFNNSHWINPRHVGIDPLIYIPISISI